MGENGLGATLRRFALSSGDFIASGPTCLVVETVRDFITILLFSSGVNSAVVYTGDVLMTGSFSILLGGLVDSLVESPAPADLFSARSSYFPPSALS